MRTVIEYLESLPPDFNQGKNEDVFTSYLQAAAAVDDVEAVQFLLQKEVNLDVVCPEQKTILQSLIAAMRAEFELWQKVQRSPRRYALSAQERGGRKYLWYNFPRINNTKAICKELLLHGAKITKEDQEFLLKHERVLRMEIETVLKKNDASQSHGELHKAVFKNNLQALKDTLAKGTDINLKDKLGYTALHYAIEQNKPKIAEFLIANGVSMNEMNLEGENPLHLAVRLKKLDLMQLLFVCEEIDFINGRDVKQQTPLQLIHQEIKKLINNNFSAASVKKVPEEWKNICVALLRHGAMADAEIAKNLVSIGLDVRKAEQEYVLRVANKANKLEKKNHELIQEQKSLRELMEKLIIASATHLDQHRQSIEALNTQLREQGEIINHLSGQIKNNLSDTSLKPEGETVKNTDRFFFSLKRESGETSNSPNLTVTVHGATSSRA